MNPNDIILLLRKIFVDEDIQATKDSLVELHLLASDYKTLEDKQRDQVFYFDSNDDQISLSRKYSDSDCNTLSISKAKGNIDIVKLNVECIALEKMLERNKIVFKIFSFMRNLINENIGVYYPVAVKDNIIYESEKIVIEHRVDVDENGVTMVNMLAKYTDKENNMVYSCEYQINENQDGSYIIQTLSGI